MATEQSQSLFQCVGCQSQLKETSKTLPCLHSVCDLCFDTILKDAEDKCPECGDAFHPAQPLTLSTILAKELKRQQFTTQEWQCDTCMEENISSGANYWCAHCNKMICTNCMRHHNKFTKGHILENLDNMERVDAIEMMMGKDCLLHGEAVESFCRRCNACYCNTCYKDHSTDLGSSSSCNNVSPLMVKDETVKMKTQVPNLETEIKEFKEFLLSSNENLSKYTDELNVEYDSKCKDVWIKYEEMVENARLDALELCEKMRQETAEEVKRWRNIFEKNSRILKEVDIWLLNLQHLQRKVHEDREVLCGLNLLTSRLPSRHHTCMQLTKKCDISFILPDWWNQAMKPCRETPAVSCVPKTIPVKKLVDENQWILPGSKSRDIRMILISEKDCHIFICDSENQSIMEMSESGQFVSELLLSDKENPKFEPYDMCSIPTEQFVVCGFGENKLIFLERIENDPFLQIQKIVPTKTQFYSLCQKNETIFACDLHFTIHSFTKEGIEIKIIKNEGLGESASCPRIRVDFSSGKFWGSSWDRSETICFNSEGEKIDSFKKENKYFDFCLNEFGQFYANYNEIFSFFQQQRLYSSEKKSKKPMPLFVFQNKLFICFGNDGQYFIKKLKIFY